MVKPNGKSEVQSAAAPRADDRATRARILEAAHRVFLRRGTARARTQEIADEAGVNKALMHYYFGTKAQLADAVFAHAIGDFLPRIFALVASTALPLDEKVRQIVREQIDFHAARPYLAGYVATELHAEPERIRRLVGVRGPVPLDALREQLARGAADGVIRPMSAEQFVANLMGLLIFPFALRPALELFLALDDERFADFIAERRATLAEFFLAGLRP